MKQHITKEQWDELSREVQRVIVVATNNLNIPNIGNLIEFLGDKIQAITIGPTDEVDDGYHVVYATWVKDEVPYDAFHSEELIDALWEAVKYKLKQ